MKVLLKRFNNLPPMIRAFSHNHGEESRKLIQLMDSRTHHSNGSNEKLDKMKQVVLVLLKSFDINI